MAQFDAKTVHKNDWGVIGGGAAVFIASFLPWYSLGPYDVNGWDSKFLATMGILLAIAAAVIVGLRVYGVDLPKLGIGWRTIVLGLAGLSAVFLILRFIIDPADGPISLDKGIGLFIAVIGSIVAAVFAYFAFSESGERADIDRMRAERAANRPAPAAPAAVSDSAPAGYVAPPPAPPAGYAAPPAAAEPHDHDHGDHEGHDHPRA